MKSDSFFCHPVGNEQKNIKREVLGLYSNKRFLLFFFTSPFLKKGFVHSHLSSVKHNCFINFVDGNCKDEQSIILFSSKQIIFKNNSVECIPSPPCEVLPKKIENVFVHPYVTTKFVPWESSNLVSNNIINASYPRENVWIEETILADQKKNKKKVVFSPEPLYIFFIFFLPPSSVFFYVSSTTTIFSSYFTQGNINSQLTSQQLHGGGIAG